MNRIIKFVVFSFLAVLILGSTIASAVTPYTTYTYDVFGKKTESPDAYVPLKVINSASIQQSLVDKKNENAAATYSSFTSFSNPSDIFVDDLNYIYVSDTDNNRIVILDEEGNLVRIISTFVNEFGVSDSLATPRGLFVTETEIYVADSGSARIVVFDKLGNFVTIVPEPAADVFPEASVYMPIAVAVDSAGRVYVVSATTNYGVIALNRDGSFINFVGPQKVAYNVFDMIWRSFMSEEQKQQSIKYVPTEYNNVTIDSEGFLYVTTSSIDAAKQQQAITSRSKADTYAPVKKLNPNGSDVMNRNGFYPPNGEIDVNQMTTPEITISGASTITDVALGPSGMWSIVDNKRSRVFTYDANGQLLFAFGDNGPQIGQITVNSLAAIDYQGSNLLLLDKTAGSITVYKRTEYGDLLAAALQNTLDQNYGKAVDYYKSILQHNNNYDSAYVGIGQSLQREGKYVEAMQYFKHAYDTENYSKAWASYRKEWIEKYVWVIPIAIVVICLAISKFFKLANKINKRGLVYKEKRTLVEEIMYGFHVIFHPFDGFWDLKHEKRGSAKGATFFLVLTIVAFLYQAVGLGYLADPYYNGLNFVMSVASVFLPVILWVVSNWCLTTLFDGEGSFKDVYVTTCYSLVPLPILVVPSVLLSNILTLDEMSIANMLVTIGFVWTVFLIFFGMMVIHDYTIGKNFITVLGTIVCMAFVMFIAILFTSLIQKVFSFCYNIYVELGYRFD